MRGSNTRRSVAAYCWARCWAIAHVAQEQADPKAIQVLISALTDPEATIRTEAASALGQINTSEAGPQLILALRDHDLEVRKAAVSSLGKRGDRAALEPLQAMLQDEVAVVQTLAKLAIAQIERQSEASDW